MATPEPFAVGKCLASVMPEKWTKSIPAPLAISANRNGLDSVCFVIVADALPAPLIRSPSTGAEAFVSAVFGAGVFVTARRVGDASGDVDDDGWPPGSGSVDVPHPPTNASRLSI